MGTGKIFGDSADIYQDQARVLFDYYKKAAEKIVASENEVQQKIQDLTDHKNEMEKKIGSYKILYIVGFVLAGAGLILGLFYPALLIAVIAGAIIGIKYLLDYKKAERDIASYASDLEAANQEFKNIRRDYSVQKIGVAYVPVATKVPYEGKSFLLDHTGTAGNTEFHLNVLHQPRELSQSIQNLQASMKKIPVVEGNNEAEAVDSSEYSPSMQTVTLHDYTGNIDRQVRNVSYLLDDSENISVDLPVIQPESKEAAAIDSYATNDPGSHPVVDVFGNDNDSKLKSFENLNAFKNQLNVDGDANGIETMTKLMSQLARSVSALSKEKNYSESRLLDYSSAIFANVLKAGFNEYSPSLEAEEIERIRNTDFDYQEAVNDYTPFRLKKSSQVRLDIFSNNWVAEDGSRTSMPFSMHQIDEEIFAPVVSALMAENRVERLKIYNNIDDQKREYLDKWNSEVGNYYRDNRKSADALITQMRETYADYMSAYNMYKSLQNTTDSLNANRDVSASEVKEIDAEAEMLAGFEAQTKECNQQQEEFASFMDRVQDNINDITKRFAHIEYYEGSLRDEVSHETAVAMGEAANLDSRRKSLVRISPYIARNAELPAEPKKTENLMKAVDLDLEEQAKQQMAADQSQEA